MIWPKHLPGTKNEPKESGQALVRAFFAAVARATREPLLHRNVHEDFRRVLLRRYPYWLYYTVEGNEIPDHFVDPARSPKCSESILSELRYQRDNSQTHRYSKGARERDACEPLGIVNVDLVTGSWCGRRRRHLSTTLQPMFRSNLGNHSHPSNPRSPCRTSTSLMARTLRRRGRRWFLRSTRRRS
jgi:hypothetical protein